MVFKSRFSRLWPYLVLLPALALYALFVLVPAVGNVVLSFTDFTGNIRLPIRWVGLDNYARAFGSDQKYLTDAIRVTFIFSISITVLQNVAGILLAVLVNAKLRLRNFYRAVIFLPNILGVVVVGLVWTLVFDPMSGPVNLLLQQFDRNSALLGDPDIALYLVIFVTMWMNVGYGMIIYLAGLQNIPGELYEAARIDGASNWGMLRYITIPLIQAAITINVLICLIGTLGLFDIIKVLTNGGPGKSTSTLSMYIFNTIFGGDSQGFVAALSMIHFAIVFVVVLIAQYFMRRRETEL
ncbi:sugar ABC transporter permease [Paenibacillus sp.]|uniref:carbohydrate ABC transporter permease n=1 Tax=Paenibacillus sp. TaxID=58172 RepID=UPI0028117A28|nr:sugar ABC transporter permease [Paenibacillus sp.]